MVTSSIHHPVLLHEAIEALHIKPSGIYIDGTFGRGGHSKAILQSLSAEGRIIGIDQDPQAVTVGQQLTAVDPRFKVIASSFVELEKIADEENIKGEEIITVLKKYGEERFARRIANAICIAREKQAITRTKVLADIVSEANPKWEKHKHPATRSFQAIRIFINKELESVEKVLDASLKVLKIGGRLVVISFHSLEDRIVKRFMRKCSKGDVYPSKVPLTAEQSKANFKVIGKAVKSGEAELSNNPRARSAVMRTMERLA